MQAKIGISPVVVLTVTYGRRWKYLSHVVESVMNDKHVRKLIIVDNGSLDHEHIENGTKKYGDRVEIIHLERNMGSAGGFAAGIERARKEECDYVFMLDDDNVPEDGAIGMFLHRLEDMANEKIVLVGNRVDIPGNDTFFYGNRKPAKKVAGTFFNIFSYAKLFNFFSLLFREDSFQRKEGEMKDMVENESFVYGGSFIPIAAIREAPLPDKDLVLYGDDLEYSWGIKKLGYASYACLSPKIHDIDMSFGEGSQVTGLFDPKAPAFKTFYRIRNMVLISRRNTSQSRPALFVNIAVWIVGLTILGIARYGIGKYIFFKLKVIFLAVYYGYFPSFVVPKFASLP